jgi:hypothetical protein
MINTNMLGIVTWMSCQVVLNTRGAGASSVAQRDKLWDFLLCVCHPAKRHGYLQARPSEDGPKYGPTSGYRLHPGNIPFYGVITTLFVQ